MASVIVGFVAAGLNRWRRPATVPFVPGQASDIMLARAAATLFGAGRFAPIAVEGARQYAAAAAEVKLPDAPLQLSGTASQIATLVWQVAAKNNQLDKVQDELAQMVEAFQTQPELARVAVDPFLPVRSKVNIMNTIMKDSQATEITKRLFVALAEENALSSSLKVAEIYEQLMLAYKKEVHCNLVTAEPLDKMEKAELRKQAAAFVDPGYSLVMAEKVDPALIGGFVLEFEDRLVDMSAAKKLQEFNDLVFKLESDLAQ